MVPRYRLRYRTVDAENGNKMYAGFVRGFAANLRGDRS